MSLPRFAVRRPVTTGMLILSVVIAGLISLYGINLDLWPSFERPVLRVTVPYPNASPSEVERRIVRPLEEELGTVRRLESVRSTAGQNQARIELEFQPGTDMDLAALEVRERAELARRRLPADVDRIDMRRFASDAQPVLRGAVSWSGDPGLLSELIERRVEPAILQVPGVAAVEFSGLEQREVTVELDQDRMRSAGITIQEVNQALARGNQDISAGEIELSGNRFLVRAEGQIRRVEELETLPVGSAGVRLGDVADVRYDFPDRDFFFRLNGSNARQAQVFKDSDANIVEVARAVQATLEDLQTQPGLEGIGFRFWQDQSQGILEALRSLAMAGLVGGGLAVIILFAFLRRLTPTLIVAAAIPVSLIFTIAILYITGASINVITLSGLMLAVGMLIDNAVVVVENIFRHRERGDEATDAAINGAAEVGLAVVAGTLTTIIVFAPLFFMTPNEMGTQLREFGMSISFAMIASLGIAFTLVPLLAVWLLRGRMPADGRIFGGLARGYRRFLDRILDHRVLTAAVALGVFGAGGYILSTLPMELMPEEDQRFIRLSVNTPRSMTFEERNVLFGRVETLLLQNREQLEIENVNAFSGPNWNNIFISVKSYSDGGQLSSGEISTRIENMLPVTPGVEWRQRRAWGSGGRVQVRLIGESTDMLAVLAEQVEWRLGNEVAGVVNLENALQAGNEEVRIRVDRQAAERQGLTSEQVAQAVSGALRGSVATRFRTGDREIDILAQLREEDRVSIGQLGNLAIGTPDGTNIPLATVADLQVVGGPQDIQRENRRTSVTVSGEIAPGSNREAAIAEVRAVMEEMELPMGYNWDLGRQFREEQQQFGEMGFAAVLALILIYILLAALFESLLLPVIIYFSIFFAVPGLGLIFLLTGTSLSILSFLGILITVGIVVNNSIVMIDLVNQMRARGIARRNALLDGCQARLRPVLMTSLTTLIGMVPMAFLAGEGMGQMFAPIGRAVIGGLTTSMLLTLTLTPVLYAWVDDIGVWMATVWAGARASALGSERAVPPATALGEAGD
ncbi:MAG: efflux RND transporter permease subunit [Gemmatimonadetes bacterium]|nr:efflux RND transporter permease subunit [Gemmatimonadota bacterium]